ncbi:hypothetical protein D3C74_131780 [compost metagenome]
MELDGLFSKTHRYVNKAQLMEWLNTEYWVAEEAKQHETMVCLRIVYDLLEKGEFTEIEGPNPYEGERHPLAPKRYR